MIKIGKIKSQAAARAFFPLLFSAIFLTPVYANDSTIVQTTVPACNITLTIKPEKRIPPENNWSTIVEIQLYNQSGTFITTFNGTTDQEGKISFDLCAQNIHLPAGLYTFRVRGYSHLIKQFNNIFTFNQQNNFVDLSAGDQFLLAGETSNVYDNYINALDISTQLSRLNTSDYKNDLNQDGVVNGLDLSNTIFNFYKYGD